MSFYLLKIDWWIISMKINATGALNQWTVLKSSFNINKLLSSIESPKNFIILGALALNNNISKNTIKFLKNSRLFLNL